MAILRRLNIETANARWTVEISDGPPNQFVCRYYGTSPKFARAVRPGEPMATIRDMGREKFIGTDVDEMLTRARAAITNIDGDIQVEQEQKLQK
jgi:hypothetical protein